MKGHREVTYTLEFGVGNRDKRMLLSDTNRKVTGVTIPRIARLLALAIRWEGLIRDETIRDYAEAARLGRVTRARMTQIMKLLDLAPDIQEAILFLPSAQRLTERSLRPLVRLLDWDEQRRLFQKITGGAPSAADSA